MRALRGDRLKIHVATENGEVLEQSTIETWLDIDHSLEDTSNKRALKMAREMAGSTFEDALRIAFVRARKEIV